MDNLFSHPGFRLIFIDDNGNMSLEGPFNDESRKKIKEYRCISHVWGTADNTKDYAWKDHDITNVNWKVEVREEKRERLFQIFNHHKGYFWMDVFCTNQEDENKPLDVMGDIYRKCKECVCLLDSVCDVPGFDSEKELWMDVAKDVKEFMETDMKRMDSKYDNLYGQIKYDSPNISLGEKYLRYFGSTARANWFQRVWTWQEAVLPQKLLLCCEQAGSYRYDPYSPELLRELFPYKCLEFDPLSLWHINLGGDETAEIGNSIKLFEYFAISDCIMYLFFHTNHDNIWNNVRAMVGSRKECTIKEDFVYGMTGILDITVPKELELGEAVTKLEEGLRKYGILGLSRGLRPDNPKNLEELYNGKIFTDGFRILGDVESSTLDDFSTNIITHGYEEYKISEKNTYGSYIRYICTYETESWEIRAANSHIYVCEEGLDMVVRADSYNIGDILKITKIGRKNCTFRVIRANKQINVLAKITDGMIEIAGSITKIVDDHEE
jgi:hypothetical protein